MGDQTNQDDDRPGRQTQTQKSPAQRNEQREDDKLGEERVSDDDNESLPEGADDRERQSPSQSPKQKSAQGDEDVEPSDQPGS